MQHPSVLDVRRCLPNGGCHWYVAVYGAVRGHQSSQAASWVMFWNDGNQSASSVLTIILTFPCIRVPKGTPVQCSWRGNQFLDIWKGQLLLYILCWCWLRSICHVQGMFGRGRWSNGCWFHRKLINAMLQPQMPTLQRRGEISLQLRWTIFLCSFDLQVASDRISSSQQSLSLKRHRCQDWKQSVDESTVLSGSAATVTSMSSHLKLFNSLLYTCLSCRILVVLRYAYPVLYEPPSALHLDWTIRVLLCFWNEFC